MYESFFEMTQRPFAAAPRVDRYFPGRSIEPARLAVERAIERAEGTSIVIGPAGCGKTLLLQAMAERFRGRFDVAMLSNGRLATRRALLQAILFELAMPYRGLEEGELRLALFDRLQPGVSQAEGLLLLIDEAHLLPLRLLEEVRMITDFMRSGEPRVRLVLAGAAALEERLATPRLGSLQQRITSRCYLEALDRNDTAAYVRHQIASVGGEPRNVFTDGAIDTIYRATEGIPRLVNQTCDHALVMACAGGVRPIDAAGIEEAWADLQQLPTPWSQAPGYSDPSSATEDSVIEFGLLDDGAPLAPIPKPATTASVSRSASSSPLAAPANETSIAGDDAAAEAIGDEIESIAPIVAETIAAARPNPETYNIVIPVERRSDADATLDVIESHLAEWETDFQPVAKQQPEVELMLSEARRDPFAEDFVEEVAVTDRYASADRLQVAPRAQVYSTEGTMLSALLNASRAMHEQAKAKLVSEPKAEAKPTVKSVEPATIKPAQTVDTSVAARSSHVEVRPVVRQTIPLSVGRQETGFAAEADPVEPEDFVIIPKRANSDADMIIIEDDPNGANPNVEATPVRKQDYRQLFARMRKE
jgi:type II secretory pathway predicted ATPase ExeA